MDSDPPVVLMMLVPPTSTLLRLTPGIRNAATCGVRPVGIATSSSWSITRCLAGALDVHDRRLAGHGDRSPRPSPTRISALTVAANDPVSSMPSRRTVLKPGSVKVTV